MSKNRTVSLILALALSAASFAPRLAMGSRLPDSYETAATDSRAHDATSAEPAPQETAQSDSAQAQPSERKGNGFARALGAPFRALARLFGGGRKSANEEAKKRKSSPPQAVAAEQTSPAPETPKQTAQAATPAPFVNKAVVKTKARKVDVTERAGVARAPAVESSEPAPSVSVATRPAEGARVVRPDETGAAVVTPKLWIPVIEGISKDPLTQGRALLEHGYVQESIAELTVAATQPGPDLVEANNLLGIAYDRIGWHKQAAEAYNRALTVAPKDATVIANLGYSLYLANDYAGALRRLRQAAKLSPGQPVIYNNLGIVLANASKYDEAYKYFAIASNEYDAHLKLASILEDQHRDRDAVKHYEAALAMQPGASAILERLVALYERTGERDKADTARRALGQPKNPQKTTTGGGGG